MSDERFIGDHPEVLDGGRTLEPGQAFEATEEEQDGAQYKRLKEEGLIIESNTPNLQAEGPSRDQLLARAKELDITGASRMRNDQLQQAITEKEESES